MSSIRTSGLDKEIADCIYGFDALTNIQPPKIISLFKCVDPKMDDLTQDNIINIIKLAVRSFGGSSLEEIVTTIASWLNILDYSKIKESSDEHVPLICKLAT